MGSQTCWVQIETDDEEGDGYVAMQFYDRPENPSYEEIIEVTESEVSIDYLEELIEYTKTKIKAEAKIESLIQKIIDICDDYQLNLDDYIEITNYDMDFEGLD